MAYILNQGAGGMNGRDRVASALMKRQRPAGLSQLPAPDVSPVQSPIQGLARMSDAYMAGRQIGQQNDQANQAADQMQGQEWRLGMNGNYPLDLRPDSQKQGQRFPFGGFRFFGMNSNPNGGSTKRWDQMRNQQMNALPSSTSSDFSY